MDGNDIVALLTSYGWIVMIWVHSSDIVAPFRGAEWMMWVIPPLLFVFQINKYVSSLAIRKYSVFVEYMWSRGGVLGVSLICMCPIHLILRHSFFFWIKLHSET